jgi:hypothetical protein
MIWSYFRELQVLMLLVFLRRFDLPGSRWEDLEMIRINLHWVLFLRWVLLLLLLFRKRLLFSFFSFLFSLFVDLFHRIAHQFPLKYLLDLVLHLLENFLHQLLLMLSLLLLLVCFSYFHFSLLIHLLIQ